MRVQETINYTPVPIEKTVRGEEVRAMTSCRAGQIVPLTIIPVLREDSASGSLTVDFEMDETVHPLLNAVAVQVQAHFVPWSAYDRFSGMDSFNRSYRGEKERPADAAPVPFFKTINYDRAAPFWKTLGVHWVQGAPIDDMWVEGYNLLVNWLRKMRSKSLAVRSLTSTTLAEAFWQHPFLWHIKPDFDQAMMDGQVDLTLTGNLPLSAAAASVGLTSSTNAVLVRNAATGVVQIQQAAAGTSASGQFQTGSTAAPSRIDPNGTLQAVLTGITAQMSGAGVKLSLANIELAKQTAAFAQLRESFKGVSDDHILDLLMMGIRVPEEQMRDPILLDTKKTIFGYTERHAMDGANLDQSVTTGKTRVQLRFRTPPMNTGGDIFVTAQIVPEQLFERMFDARLGVTSPNQLPQADRDFLDPEKVEVVPNKYVDVLHSTPTGTFGYAPLNHQWKRSFTRIGGRYFRPTPDTFVEDRQRFWSVEQLNPALNSDFYLVRDTLPHSVFADTVSDPFTITTLGSVSFVGLTQFGKAFEENADHYDQVDAVVDGSRLVGVPGN